jgi:hypothetical protein
MRDLVVCFRKILTAFGGIPQYAVTHPYGIRNDIFRICVIILGEINLIKLGVNIDHVATLRQARLGVNPDVLEAALL